ncbi:MAG: c-type cytochrome [Calditrichaeota bacterium]|nr:c-type cytochrome [Calditrichota bacterium]MCB9369643.1 c-type cytochrome [Calditrichota bacterium]
MSLFPPVFRLMPWILGILLLGIVGCSNDDDDDAVTSPVSARERFNLKPLGPIPYPDNNPPMQERISLGKFLFYDPILGGEMDASCATCHHPAFAFADLRQFPVGVAGSGGLGPDRIRGNSSVTSEPVGFTPRNSPTIFNTAFNADETGLPTHNGFFFWDGRVKSLEVQATKPITSRVEMRGDAYPGDDSHAANSALDSVLNRLRGFEEYVERFSVAFPQEFDEWQAGTRAHVIDSSTYGRAMASYERELVTRNSAYDRYVAGDDHALTAAELRGLELFFTKAKCAECHSGPMFSDFEFIVNGVPQEGPGKAVIPGDDCGREEHTLNQGDRYAFRTPTLRNVELTPPYMHDGVFENLEQVMAFYNDGAFPRHPECSTEELDPLLRDPLGLTNDEIQDIIAFMKSLTDPGSQLSPFLMTVPDRVPSGLVPVLGLSAGPPPVGIPG